MDKPWKHQFQNESATHKNTHSMTSLTEESAIGRAVETGRRLWLAEEQELEEWTTDEHRVS